MDYKLAVFIGRFQPFHVGHQHVIDEALNIADKVLILIGSSFEPRSLRNPWFYAEREAMIRSCYTEDDNKRIICKPLRDIRYNDALWISQVQKAVYAVDNNTASPITLVGKHSQSSGYYMTFFPQWDNNALEHDHDMSGTTIRDHLFSGKNPYDLSDNIPETVLNNINGFMASTEGDALKKEFSFIELYKKGWENAPFAPTHVTVDAVVIQSGHVLLVKRGAQPGKGLLALPGGFIHPEETLTQAIVRKLKEETQIKVPPPVLVGSIKDQCVFDAPFRSSRGRTITHAFHMELRSEESLPKIKGGGESASCQWVPLGQLDSTVMFEDHYFIIQKMLGMM
jgi:bifunctional NMN adenylyltransferase/nudix hydrolase